MRKNNIRKHFSSLSSNTGAPIKKFWDSVKPFLNDKGSHGNENYSLIEDGKPIRDEGLEFLRFLMTITYINTLPSRNY